jgi:hypothetical protein
MSSKREAAVERKAAAQEEMLQKKVKQLEDQLQETKQKQDKERSDNEARRVKVGPINTFTGSKSLPATPLPIHYS